MPPTRTRIMLNVADPSTVFDLSFLPHEGVGLARMEFIVNHAVRIHPMALLHEAELEPKTRRQIAAITDGWDDKPAFFVERLALGIGKIAAAFWPADVIVRLSDFKTNEYAALIGGRGFEPSEENPMLGFRGASRYVHPRYAEAFALECAAVRRVIDDMGLRNLKLMVPFCRTVAEGEAVLRSLAEHGLERGRDGLEVYVMCEVPSNVVCAAAFAAIFDGFSIGSNDLTQLVLGVDRDSEILADLFDERDPAVLSMIRTAIAEARRAGRKIGICGQAPSDHPDLAAMLVEAGIDAISVTPDALIRTRRLVAEAEARLAG